MSFRGCGHSEYEIESIFVAYQNIRVFCAELDPGHKAPDARSYATCTIPTLAQCSLMRMVGHAYEHTTGAYAA